ncbi:MAG: hypothetical protein J7M38_09655 [Armatimonadetes bacterium]|nr:hypothetical protein [Armatimonadota bacterium]
MTKTALGLTAIMVAGLLFTGLSAPTPAHANDAGRIIAGIVVGALVYEMLDDDNYSSHHRYYGRDRGYYNGNSRHWDYRSSRRHSSRYYRPTQYRSSSRRAYNRGYNRGWNNGYNYGYNRGYDRGWDRGYRRGYDNGWDDRGDWDNWGYGSCW